MRGKESNGKPSELVSRITPACAGKRYILYFSHDFAWDHPRMCGEKPLGLAPAGWPSGSPPHVRGKAFLLTPAMVLSRITPACAGKSWSNALPCSRREDHPRVCGEKFFAAYGAMPLSGSPPRMRGKGKSHRTWHFSDRITPAYAGKRLKRSRSTVPPVAIVPLFPSVCNKPVVSDGSPAGRDAPLFLPAENAVPASPAYNLRSL